ncbi:MAG: HU family DNA-binding protein, partial [Clostridia bacterium]
MNKADFIKAVAAKADISLKDASAAVDAFAAVVADA